jgi:hypothetical protein
MGMTAAPSAATSATDAQALALLDRRMVRTHLLYVIRPLAVAIAHPLDEPAAMV